MQDTLYIYEDTGLHENNFMWAYQVRTCSHACLTCSRHSLSCAGPLGLALR